MGKLVRAGSYRPDTTKWLLTGRVPRVGLTMFQGTIKAGKSLLLYDFAARVTRGDTFPPTGEQLEQGGAVILQGEDDRDTIEERLIAAGADRSKIIYHDKTHSPVRLPDDLRDVERAIREIGARLLIIDPWGQYFQHSYSRQVRSRLEPLMVLSERLGCALIGSNHIIKTANVRPEYWGEGSVGLSGGARSILLVERGDQESYLVHVAVNRGSPQPTIAFRPADDRIEWLGARPEIGLRDLARYTGDTEEVRRAEDVLVELLGQAPQLVDDVRDEVKAAALSQKAFQAARKNLGIETKREGVGEKWRLYRMQLPPGWEGRYWRNRATRKQGIGADFGSSDQTDSRTIDGEKLATCEVPKESVDAKPSHEAGGARHRRVSRQVPADRRQQNLGESVGESAADNRKKPVALGPDCYDLSICTVPDAITTDYILLQEENWTRTQALTELAELYSTTPDEIAEALSLPTPEPAPKAKRGHTTRAKQHCGSGDLLLPRDLDLNRYKPEEI